MKYAKFSSDDHLLLLDANELALMTIGLSRLAEEAPAFEELADRFEDATGIADTIATMDAIYEGTVAEFPIR